MKKGTLSVSMDAALNAWALRNGKDINQHAVAHGVSPSGLYRALLAAGLIERKPKAEQKPA